jgi:hypothetical protein
MFFVSSSMWVTSPPQMGWCSGVKIAPPALLLWDTIHLTSQLKPVWPEWPHKLSEKSLLFSLLQTNQMGSGFHPTSYSIGTGLKNVT